MSIRLKGCFPYDSRSPRERKCFPGLPGGGTGRHPGGRKCSVAGTKLPGGIFRHTRIGSAATGKPRISNGFRRCFEWHAFRNDERRDGTAAKIATGREGRGSPGMKTQIGIATTENKAIALPRAEGFPSFRTHAEFSGWHHLVGSALSLLMRAQHALAEAEQTIGAQKERIRQLEQLATSDELTGLKNRRGFFERFTADLDRCNRGFNEGGMLLLIDLDDFKHVNDKYGHAAGDSCLRLIARVLFNQMRTMDVVARLGGDEFIVLMPDTCCKKAANRIADLRLQLNNLSMAWYGEEIPVRASIGVRDYKRGDTAEQIFDAADAAMYESKAGRKDAGKQDGAGKNARSACALLKEAAL